MKRDKKCAKMATPSRGSELNFTHEKLGSTLDNIAAKDYQKHV